MATKSFSCPVEAALHAMGGKWKVLILWNLRGRTLRFGELKREVAGITQKMLTQQLRELEKDGLVNRKVHAQVPPKVEYSLTGFGCSLEPILDDLFEWGKVYARHTGVSIRCLEGHKEEPAPAPKAAKG